ncbi:MAG: uvrC [Gammaproteobacteria bacterium]|jgi:excinuclease ABC subunit C|nr:uvrC [Gammaproteobacteria bacterium]
MFDYHAYLKTVPTDPGVYQMYNTQEEIIYIGKARNLKNRVSSYFRQTDIMPKTRALVQQIAKIETIVTHSDSEALILESNLIKKYRPRYNVLFRDDKSYPYLCLSQHTDYPSLTFYRGRKKEKGQFFGPYPSSIAVRETLNLMQKLFKLRQCQDSFFRNRNRPCLQYQIKRCTAPCVDYITPQQYQEDVRHALLFLQGKNEQIIDDLVNNMNAAATALNYELAAHYRDQIASIRHVQEKQYVTADGENVDVIAVSSLHGSSVVQVLAFREGRLLGNKAYFPKTPPDTTEEEILGAFLPQYYLNPNIGRLVPKQVLINHDLQEQALLEQSLSAYANYKVNLASKVRGQRARWLQLAEQNAKLAIAAHLAEKTTVYGRLEALQEILQLDSLPERIECFDISHTSGEATIGACVVYTTQGPLKSDYRRFNIEGVAPGDDYAAMYQALLRRYKRLKTEDSKLPEVVLIDGGKGQLQQAEKVFEELQIAGVMLIGVAKGTTRKPGLETLFIAGQATALQLSPDSMALHLIQEIRDEAHRFAIIGHRAKRAKKHTASMLETIPGVGAKRRRSLIQHFGGWQGVKNASKEEIARVEGISRAMADKIYEALRD